MTPFLDLAISGSSASSREDVLKEFYPKLVSVSDDVEFDLVLWSLARSLGVDSEELVRQVGERWFASSGLIDEISTDPAPESPMEILRSALVRLSSIENVPLVGMDEFSIEPTLLDGDRLKVSCRGARRCCSFVEGIARALCAALGFTLRYIRQPKGATRVLISFNCVAV